MPVSKVDSRCFTLSKKIDGFLSLGNVSKTNLTPPDFWKEIVQSEEAVSSYIVCLIAKLISLDSEHGLKPLPNVYKDLVEMPVDHSKYKQWSSKPLPTNCKSAALELQYSIITTIRHLKDCYGYAPNIHLRHMYLRWNLARNYCTDGARKADEYEEKVISPFSVAQSKEVIRSPLNSPLHKSITPVHSPHHLSALAFTPEDEEELVLIRRLVDECYSNHRRAFFGALPPQFCKLCSYTNATDCLSYIHLRDLTSRNPTLLKAAMTHVLNILNGEVSHIQSYGEREVLFPLLHLFREFLTMMCPVNTVDVYRSLMPFYMWPISHSQYTRGVLDQIMKEGCVRGTTIRKRILSEQDMGLKPSETKIRGHLVHMLVDTSHPFTRGSLLHEIFTTHQEKPDNQVLQRFVIRNVFKAADIEFNVVELERKLQHLSLDSLRNFCIKALEVVEKVTAMKSSEDHGKSLKRLSEELLKEIIEHTESDEQRDSAVSCSGIDTELQLTEDYLGSCAIPPSYIHTHSLENTQYPTIITKLRETLIRCRQKITPFELKKEKALDENTIHKQPTIEVVPSPSRKAMTTCMSSSSQTSLDSTGSSMVEQEAPNEIDMSSIDRNTPKERPHTDEIIANGYVGHVTSSNDHVTSNQSHMINGDDHVSSDQDHVNINGCERRRPTSLQCDNDIDSNSNHKGEDLEKPSSDTTRSCDKLSLASGDCTSESSSVQDYSPSTIRKHASSPNSRLIRRQTCPSGMYVRRTSSLLGSSPSSPSSNARRYTNVSGQPVVIRSSSVQGTRSTNTTNSVSSLKVKLRRNSSAQGHSVKRRVNTRNNYFTAGNPTTKLVKILLAGNDLLVSHTARAYAHLQMEEPNLLSGMELRFYHIPLSRASLFPESAQSTAMTNQMLGTSGNQDLPEPMFEQLDNSGNDVHIGRFLAHMDSWYERNVMMAVHHLLRLLPSDLPSDRDVSPIPEAFLRPLSPISPVTVGETTRASRTNLTPSKVLIEAVNNYSREALNCIPVNMYKLKFNIKNEKSHKYEHREEYMFHRLDIQRLSGKKTANRQVKTFEANINMTQISLGGSLIRSDLMEMKDVWVIRASNVPRAGDSCVPNPESDSFELTIIKALSEGGRFGATKFRPSEETQYHVCDMTIETRDKPFTVMVDSDNDVLYENVVRLAVTPASMEEQQSLATAQPKDMREKKIQFPLMTYWPVDL